MPLGRCSWVTKRLIITDSPGSPTPADTMTTEMEFAGSSAHMNRKFKLAPSPTCACGQEDQTAEHILQRCPLLDEERKEVWPSPTPLQTKLYGSRQELEKTTTFITSAGLIV
ncbi:hypothetical protein V1264_008743 [Littorina saxatilis]|uniref:Reverse transcriptase n=1 Tax=Littorina saxatilis TaxID=31220 RepID=A0AAN9G2M1_9CAEN